MAVDDWKKISKIFVLCVSFLILIITYSVTRLPYYLYYPMVSLQPDSFNYVSVANQISSWQLPDISYRTIGYPLFIWLATVIHDSWASVVTLQNFISLLAVLSLTYVIYTIRMYLSIPVSIALAAFASSNHQIINDFAILTESVFSSCLIFSLTFLLLGLWKKKSVYFLICSLVMSYATLVRPTGFFLIPILCIVSIFFLINKYKVNNYVALWAPYVLVLSIVTVYNGLHYGKFTFTDGGGYTWIITSGSFLEQDNSYTPAENNAIATIQEKISPKDKYVILNTWNYNEFYPSYHKYFNCGEIWGPLNVVSDSIPERMDIIKRIAMDSIKKHFEAYLKIVLFNSITLFWVNYHYDNDYFMHITQMYNMHIRDKDFYNLLPKNVLKDYYKDYYMLNYFPGFTNNSENGKTSLQHTKLKDFFVKFTHIQNILFRNLYWAAAPAIVLMLGIIFIIKTRCKQIGPFFVVIICLYYVGHVLLCALFSNDNRFVAVVIFANYVSVALIPLLAIQLPEERT